MKALFINGSPRKNGNTAQLLKRAMDGAREAGAEVELVNLYDRNLNYKGCMSCFACKLKGGKKGVCSFKDDLQPILQKAVEADVLVCGSPNYCGYPSAALRAFMERMEFPAVNYSDYSKPVVLKRICSATIYTMNCPNEEVYRQMNYPLYRLLWQKGGVSCSRKMSPVLYGAGLLISNHLYKPQPCPLCYLAVQERSLCL